MITKQKHSKRRVSWLVFSLVIILLGAASLATQRQGYGLANASSETEAPAADRLLVVDSLTVKVLDGYEVEESYVGQVVSRRSSSLGFERSGQVKSVLVDEGDKVAQGDILARLDTRRLEAKIAELKAELERSQAKRQEVEIRQQLATKTANRNRQMVKKKQVSPQAYDESIFEERAISAQLAGAEAQVKYVEATIKVLEVDLDRSTLTAPFAGSIVSRRVDEGTAIAVGERVLRLIEDQSLEVHVGVPVHAIANLVTGEDYEIEINRQGHPARLRTLLSEIDPSTRTVTAIFELGPDAATTRVGQLSRLKMTNRTEARGFWLPITALSESRRGLWGAYALEPTESDASVWQVSRRELQMLHGEEERAFVRGTLKDGEVVVATGLHRLVPGQKVRPSKVNGRGSGTSVSEPPNR